MPWFSLVRVEDGVGLAEIKQQKARVQGLKLNFKESILGDEGKEQGREWLRKISSP